MNPIIPWEAEPDRIDPAALTLPATQPIDITEAASSSGRADDAHG